MIHNDHVQVCAIDAAATAALLADILGVGEPTPEGIDDDMFRLDFDHGEFLLVAPAPPSIPFAHVAYRVDGARFAGVVERLKARGVHFGNHHDDTSNGQTDDPLGGAGRVYFHDDNGHLWEVAC